MASNEADVGPDEAEAGPDEEAETGGGVQAPDTGGEERRTPGADEQYCSSCGEVIKKEAEICPECGVRQKPATASYEKDRTVAGILAILLGGLGVHKFYLGQTGMGLLYLCFSWTFIPAIIGFVEGILYLTKSDEEFQRKYVKDS